MPDLEWKEAITEVLKKSDEPLHYAEIADRIAAQELREEFGATPAASVNATISISSRTTVKILRLSALVEVTTVSANRSKRLNQSRKPRMIRLKRRRRRRD
jgi:hypothetical protein